MAARNTNDKIDTAMPDYSPRWVTQAIFLPCRLRGPRIKLLVNSLAQRELNWAGLAIGATGMGVTFQPAGARERATSSALGLAESDRPALFVVERSVGGEAFTHKHYDHWPQKIVGGAGKRIFDLVAGSALLVFVSPVLAFAALCVWAQDGSSPFFRQTRIGVGGRPFQCFKLRSMVKDGHAKLEALLATDPAARAEWNRTRKLSKDPRITPLGELLRKTSVDELPQLLNILRGEMSLIGPRPIVPDELSRYDLDRVHYFRARPGLTGLWQVSGRSTTSYAARVALDKSYTLHWSFLRDIGILLRTLPAVLFQRGAA